MGPMCVFIELYIVILVKEWLIFSKILKTDMKWCEFTFMVIVLYAASCYIGLCYYETWLYNSISLFFTFVQYGIALDYRPLQMKDSLYNAI